MLIKDWDELPDFMRNDEVKPYYESLKRKQGQLILKRCFDVVCSLILIILLSPVFLIIAIWIKMDSKGPIFYRQERITQYGRTFRIFKFRTMVINADKIGTLVTTKNDARITRVGEKIRKYRIDEIPQLFNVLTGDMSFVGTRPEVKKYVNAYTKEMYATLLLPAGITSLASIKFKDEDEILCKCVATDKMIDIVYIREILPEKMVNNLHLLYKFSLFDEMKILIDTLKNVFS